MTKCNDQNCPVHGSLKTRGRAFTGTVTEAKMQRTATVEWSYKHYLPKFERYETRSAIVKAHNPECIDAKKGSFVRLQECRKLSKTKSFVITQDLGKNIAFAAKEELMKEAKVPEKEKQLEESHETS